MKKTELCTSSSDSDSDSRPMCKYGTDCYRKNTKHRMKFRHPPKVKAAKSKIFKRKVSPIKSHKRKMLKHKRSMSRKSGKKNKSNELSSSDESYERKELDDEPSPKRKKLVKKKMDCRYGTKCYRKNLLHFAEFNHPLRDNGKKNENESDSNDASDTDSDGIVEKKKKKYQKKKDKILPKGKKGTEEGPLIKRSYSILSEDERKKLIAEAMRLKHEIKEREEKCKKELEETKRKMEERLKEKELESEAKLKEKEKEVKQKLEESKRKAELEKKQLLQETKKKAEEKLKKVVKEEKLKRDRLLDETKKKTKEEIDKVIHKKEEEIIAVKENVKEAHLIAARAEEKAREESKQKKELEKELKKKIKEALEKQTELKKMQEDLANAGEMLIDGEKEALSGNVVKYFPLYAKRTHDGSVEQRHFRLAESQFYRLLDSNDFRVTMVEYVISPKLVKKFKIAGRKLKKINEAHNTSADKKNESADNDIVEHNPVLGFHGTSECNIHSICQNGFHMPGKSKNFKHTTDAGWYGRGVYFSEYPQYAIEYITQGNKLLLCQVLLGKIYHCTKLLHGADRHEGFDSHMSPDGKEVVVFDNDHILPSYIVNYEKKEGDYEYKRPIDIVSTDKIVKKKDTDKFNQEWIKSENAVAALAMAKKVNEENKDETNIFRGIVFGYCGKLVTTHETFDEIIEYNGATATTSIKNDEISFVLSTQSEFDKKK